MFISQQIINVSAEESSFGFPSSLGSDTIPIRFPLLEYMYFF